MKDTVGLTEGFTHSSRKFRSIGENRIKNMISLLKWAACLAGLVAIAGCKPSSGLATTPVSITVTYKGQPVEGANVSMSNTTVQPPAVAVGRTDAQGVAVMKTGDDIGAVKGINLVMINKYEAAASTASAEVESESYDPNVQTKAPKSLLPVKYSSGASGLTVTVGDTPIQETFDLVD
jgi:hypothetical protein